MARRPRPEDDDVSLFPFLSIICAIIGVLTLMIAAVTLGQMNEDGVKEAVENAPNLNQLRAELAAVEKAIADLTQTLKEQKSNSLKKGNRRQAELINSRARLKKLAQQLSDTKKKIEEQKKIRIVIPEIPQEQRETVADLQMQLAAVKERMAILQLDLDKKTEPPEEAQVSIVPGGSGLNFFPNFVECTAEAIVMHTDDPPLTIRKADIPAHERFLALMQFVANNNQQTIVFLVRSDSLGTYRMVKKLCDDNNVRNGKLPAVGNGRLDFSHFRRR